MFNYNIIMTKSLAFYYKKVNKDWLINLLNTLRYHIDKPNKNSPIYTRIKDIAKVTGFRP